VLSDRDLAPINRSQIQATSQIKEEQKRSSYDQENSAEAIAETSPTRADSAPAPPAAKRSPTPHDCLLRMQTFRPRKNAGGPFPNRPHPRTAIAVSMQNLIVNRYKARLKWRYRPCSQLN